MACASVIHDKSWLCESVFGSFNNHNHEQPSASPAPIQHLSQAAKCRGQSEASIRLIPCLTFRTGVLPVFKQRITKYHSPPRIDPQTAPSQSHESSFHPIAPKTSRQHACKALPSKIRHLDAIGLKNISFDVDHLLAQNHDDKYKFLCSHQESRKGRKRRLNHWNIMGGSDPG